MKVYRLSRTQKIPLSLEDAWSYFSSPKNLQEITPDDLKFRILTDILEDKMYSGQIINYIVTPLLNIPMRWTTEIKHVEEGVYFVDEQRFGPYALWHHKHFFKAVDGGVELMDIVDYALPLGPLGRFAHWLFVRRQLESIFRYRSQKLEQMFGTI
ncbi:SRPBCC family protein [Salibacteraceae bacterium]|jgi:ligand-binding SRPBCC domain-containing protein|nr:SRPBCC family protein [Salibacteraceae bacterium]MDC1304181.1 SRPBCC family protein [Salibacteraceae bacterium]HAQ70315.1 cell division inhibitor [Flavobacteriales bacterium]